MKKLTSYIRSVGPYVSATAVTFLAPLTVRAEDTPSGPGATLQNLSDVGTAAYGEGAVAADKTLPNIIGGLIQQLLGLIGVVMVVIIVYAGFLWMTAGGSEEKVSKAKKWIINSSIGLAVIMAAYAITAFVVEAIIYGTAGSV